MTRTHGGPYHAVRKSWAGGLLIIFAVAGLVWAQASGAANVSVASADPDALSAALATIQEAKTQARAKALNALQQELTPLEKEWGIKLYGIRWTSSGYMLHLRFRVLDPEKAFPLLRRHVDRYVIVEKSGAVLQVPFTAKLGSLRASVRTANMVKESRTYGSLFANPGRHVKPGDKVTLVIGNFMAEHLTVQ